MGRHRAVSNWAGKYIHLAGALFGAIASSVVALGITGGHITTTEWVNIGIASVGAVQVWYVTNTSDNPNGKAVIAGIAAALVALQSFVSGAGHISLAEWMQVGLAALTATGLWGAPGFPRKSATLASPISDPVYVNLNGAQNFVTGKFTTALTGQRAEVTRDGIQITGPDEAPPRQDLP